MKTDKKIELIEELNEMEYKQADLNVKLKSMERVIERVVNNDLMSVDPESNDFLYNFKNGIAELNVLQAALQSMSGVSNENLSSILFVIKELEKTDELSDCEAGEMEL